MIRLTQQQMNVLVSAAAQRDGFAIRPVEMKPGTAAKIAGTLIEHGLVREVHSKGEAPVWREDEDGKRFSLRISKAGRTVAATSAEQGRAPIARATPGHELAGTELGKPTAYDAAASKPLTKRALVLSLMDRDGGATLDELIAATGWLPHTTRAALTGLRKDGFAVERSRRGEGGPSIYKVMLPTTAKAA